MSTDDRVRVASVDEFGDGERRFVRIGDTGVGVINVDGDYYALENECPHQGGPVCTGRVGGKIVAEHPGVGERTRERISGEQVIACPWHGWEYDLASGEHIGNPDVALETFEVEVRDGEVYVRR